MNITLQVQDSLKGMGPKRQREVSLIDTPKEIRSLITRGVCCPPLLKGALSISQD